MRSLHPSGCDWLLLPPCVQVVGKPQPSFFQLALDDLQVTHATAAAAGPHTWFTFEPRSSAAQQHPLARPLLKSFFQTRGVTSMMGMCAHTMCRHSILAWCIPRA
jgi:hypothetical protein